MKIWRPTLLPIKKYSFLLLCEQDLSDKIATRDVVRVLGDELRARTVDITNCLSQVSSLPLTPSHFLPLVVVDQLMLFFAVFWIRDPVLF
jgi:hypothetical protein